MRRETSSRRKEGKFGFSRGEKSGSRLAEELRLDSAAAAAAAPCTQLNPASILVDADPASFCRQHTHRHTHHPPLSDSHVSHISTPIVMIQCTRARQCACNPWSGTVTHAVNHVGKPKVSGASRFTTVTTGRDGTPGEEVKVSMSTVFSQRMQTFTDCSTGPG